MFQSTTVISYGKGTLLQQESPTGKKMFSQQMHCLGIGPSLES